MSELVKRLRDVGYCSPEDVVEAADHIEKLETALREIAKTNNSRDRFSADIDTIIINALGDENDDA